MWQRTAIALPGISRASGRSNSSLRSGCSFNAERSQVAILWRMAIRPVVIPHQRVRKPIRRPSKGAENTRPHRLLPWAATVSVRNVAAVVPRRCRLETCCAPGYDRPFPLRHSGRRSRQDTASRALRFRDQLGLPPRQPPHVIPRQANKLWKRWQQSASSNTK